MAILALSFLQSLSFCGAEALLIQEGYVEEDVIEQDDELYERKFLYPYSLYDRNGKRIDCIYYIEYCRQVMDEEYGDGRMTWEDIKTEWRRDPACSGLC